MTSSYLPLVCDIYPKSFQHVLERVEAVVVEIRNLGRVLHIRKALQKEGANEVEAPGRREGGRRRRLRSLLRPVDFFETDIVIVSTVFFVF